ncbi:hypothetical protein SPW_0308 [Streptomyces sp. W007]|nr:hypothetical protein SPW_0308 [Streptomyces sp. W007]
MVSCELRCRLNGFVECNLLQVCFLGSGAINEHVHEDIAEGFVTRAGVLFLYSKYGPLHAGISDRLNSLRCAPHQLFEDFFCDFFDSLLGC